MGPMVIDSCLPPCSVHGPSVLGPVNPTTAGDDPRWLVGAVPPKKALSGALGWASLPCFLLSSKQETTPFLFFWLHVDRAFKFEWLKG